MMCRLSAREYRHFRGLLAASLLWVSAAKGVAQSPPQVPGFTPAPATGGASTPSAPILAQRSPSQVAAQPPTYAQPAPRPQNNSDLSYSPQPMFAAQPPGYGPLAPPPQFNGAGQFAPSPIGQPYPGMPMQPGPIGIIPMPPGPYPSLPVSPPVLPALPEMVYLVTSKFWFRPEALLWWTKDAPVRQPIVTTGSTSDAVPGAVGQPGTQTLFGGGNASLGYVVGIRLETGVWLDARRRFGLEAGYFALIQQIRQFVDQSDAFGDPVIARPTINAQTGRESAYLSSMPFEIVGGVNVVLRSEFQGANCDGVVNLIQTQQVRLDGLVGFRYLSLVESLNISDQYVDTFGGTRSFAGTPLNLFNGMSDFDGFRVTNSFYGGSAGARLYYARERWFFSALGKVAWGPVQQRATLSGSTTFTDPNGNQTFLPGGILVTTANMGRYYQSAFAVAPEGHFDLGYQLTPFVTVRIGYSFIYLSNVARPGDQVTRVTSANRVPSDPAYGSAGPSLPAFQFHTTSYWAQGLNFGLDLRF
jgi:hypothetical protein